VVVQDTSGTTLAIAYIQGVGTGPQVSFLPGIVSGWTFFLPKMAAPASAGKVVASRSAIRVAPAVDLAREIMICSSLW
jgi:hypothetical protein